VNRLDDVERLKSVYFGGGTPALCALEPLFKALAPRLAADCEFTVELHPEDVSEKLLDELVAGGVTRISMGVQSLDDKTLRAMGRGYTAAEAERAFRLVKTRFANAGVDFIVGYPDDPCAGFERLADWELSHCSVYSLQNERGLKGVPSDGVVLDRIREVAAVLEELGLTRYEISNYAASGRACRHNLAVWRGEDYLGLGEGACGRVGLVRTRHFGTPRAETETVSAAFDEKERRLFRLRTREGLDASGHPEWEDSLAAFCREGLLTRAEDNIYTLTPRGTEVCDALLAELV